MGHSEAKEEASENPQRENPRRRLVRDLAPFVLLVCGSGVMAASWLDERFFPGAWVGMFVLVYLTCGQPAHLAFRRGMVFGLVAIISAFHWVPQVLSKSFAISYLATSLFFLFVAACDAFHFGLATYLTSRLRTSRFGASLVFPVCFIGLEFLWIRVFPWRLAHSQIAWTSFIQIAEFVGVYGVGFVMAWTVSIAAMWLKGMVHRGETILGASVFVASLIFGTWRIGDIEAKVGLQKPLRVALVQVDVRKQDAVVKLQTVSREVEHEVDLICWPESSVGAYDLQLTDFMSEQRLRELSLAPIRPLQNPRCALLCAGQSYGKSAMEKGPFFVTAFLIDRQENILGRYHKRTLLPLGEYMPGIRWFPWLAKLLLIQDRISPGTSPAILDLPNRARIGALICYEDMLDRNARTSARAGAEILVVLANGCDFDNTPAQRQHQQLAHFRAIENRRYFLRCATTGSTAVISPTGKLVARLPPNQDGILPVTVHPYGVMAVYTRIGNVVGYLCVIGMGILIVQFRRWEKSQEQQAENSG